MMLLSRPIKDIPYVTGCRQLIFTNTLSYGYRILAVYFIFV